MQAIHIMHYISQSIVHVILMHAKYMHDLYCLLMHIPTYYNVNRCYNHDYNVLWGISIDPPYFGYNSAGQENSVLHIFAFQGPFRTQIDLGFLER
jgi:hypothetical protein